MRMDEGEIYMCCIQMYSYLYFYHDIFVFVYCGAFQMYFNRKGRWANLCVMYSNERKQVGSINPGFILTTGIMPILMVTEYIQCKSFISNGISITVRLWYLAS